MKAFIHSLFDEVLMAEGWVTRWKAAYVDLHVAYLALMRMRHQRKDSPADLMERDMRQMNPFYMEGAVGEEAVAQWLEMWEKSDQENPAARAMACVTLSMQKHWESWAAFMDLCPPDMRKHKIAVPFDSYLLTATTVSRSTLEARAKVLVEARERHLKGEV